MVKSDARRKMMTEFFLSCRTTGQLFFKTVHTCLLDLEDFEHNHSYWQVLKVLKQMGPMSQRAIARELHHSDAAISRQISMLLEKHYVTAIDDPNNRRSTIVDLTDKGRKMTEEAEAIISQRLIDLLSPLSDEDIQQLLSGHRKLQQLLENNLRKDL